MNDGKVFSWDSPPEGGHPGEDYGCRCEAEEFSDDDVSAADRLLPNLE